nr:MAG TPA: hypothetical protein [Caudoviricetes sp.]
MGIRVSYGAYSRTSPYLTPTVSHFSMTPYVL